MDAAIFLVTLQAVETTGGPPLAVLAFARADGETAAMKVAVDELAAFGWTDIEAVRTGEITDFDALPHDFRPAVDTARRFGCGLIIYDPPG